MISRRELLISSLLAGSALLTGRSEAENRDEAWRGYVAALERRCGGCLGAAALSGAHPKVISYRGHQHFPVGSTFMFPAAAFVLARVDRGQESLSRRIVYAKDCLVPSSPTTEKHAGTGGLTVGELCEAAVTLSDNTAGNLLLDSFGGSAALTAYVRSLGDPVTQFNRPEPTVSEATPGDLRDTTTPIAMLDVLRKTLLGNALSGPSRTQLAAWYVATKMGDDRVRRRVVLQVRDTTDSGARSGTGDSMRRHSRQSSPVLVSVYYTNSHASESEREAVSDEVRRLVKAVLY